MISQYIRCRILPSIIICHRLCMYCTAQSISQERRLDIMVHPFIGAAQLMSFTEYSTKYTNLQLFKCLWPKKDRNAGQSINCNAILLWNFYSFLSCWKLHVDDAAETDIWNIRYQARNRFLLVKNTAQSCMLIPLKPFSDRSDFIWRHQEYFILYCPVGNNQLIFP